MTRRSLRSYSDFPTIIDSISGKLLKLPPQTVVHPGHGNDTTVGAEAPHLQEWIDRGHWGCDNQP
jgi:glyoxylase-like metal-dependent hydrolase (beta-lactamase superfamily II)